MTLTGQSPSPSRALALALLEARLARSHEREASLEAQGLLTAEAKLALAEARQGWLKQIDKVSGN